MLCLSSLPLCRLACLATGGREEEEDKVTMRARVERQGCHEW